MIRCVSSKIILFFAIQCCQLFPSIVGAKNFPRYPVQTEYTSQSSVSWQSYSSVVLRCVDVVWGRRATALCCQFIYCLSNRDTGVAAGVVFLTPESRLDACFFIFRSTFLWVLIDWCWIVLRCWVLDLFQLNTLWNVLNWFFFCE